MVEATAPLPVQTEKKTRIPLLLPLFLFLLIGLFYLARSVVPQVLLYLTKAANVPGRFSLANSYLFGSPLLAQADGQEKIRVTAFLLDTRGKGVPKQTISLTVRAKDPAAAGLPQVAPIQPSTDEFGRAVFEVTSALPGQFVITASAGGLEFPQTVTLTFR